MVNSPTQKYKVIKRKARTIPFGYKLAEDKEKLWKNLKMPKVF